MYKGYTEWIMKLFAEMAIQIDFSLSLTVYFVSELSRIRSAHHKDAEGPSGKGHRKGLGMMSLTSDSRGKSLSQWR